MPSLIFNPKWECCDNRVLRMLTYMVGSVGGLCCICLHMNKVKQNGLHSKITQGWEFNEEIIAEKKRRYVCLVRPFYTINACNTPNHIMMLSYECMHMAVMTHPSNHPKSMSTIAATTHSGATVLWSRFYKRIAKTEYNILSCKVWKWEENHVDRNDKTKKEMQKLLLTILYPAHLNRWALSSDTASR